MRATTGDGGLGVCTACCVCSFLAAVGLLVGCLALPYSEQRATVVPRPRSEIRRLHGVTDLRQLHTIATDQSDSAMVPAFERRLARRGRGRGRGRRRAELSPPPPPPLPVPGGVEEEVATAAAAGQKAK